VTRPASRAAEGQLLVAVALGGAVGAVLRWVLGELVPDGSGFPWTTFAVNLSGSFGLALLPAMGGVRRSPLLIAGLGPGLLGGYTTLSAYADQTRTLLAAGRVPLAAAYAIGTLAACLVAAALANMFSSKPEQQRFGLSGGDE
jgi:CrcB protein